MRCEAVAWYFVLVIAGVAVAPVFYLLVLWLRRYRRRASTLLEENEQSAKVGLSFRSSGTRVLRNQAFRAIYNTRAHERNTHTHTHTHTLTHNIRTRTQMYHILTYTDDMHTAMVFRLGR